MDTFLPLNRFCRDCRYYRDIGVGFCIFRPLGRPPFVSGSPVCLSFDPLYTDDVDDHHRQPASVPP